MLPPGLTAFGLANFVVDLGAGDDTLTTHSTNLEPPDAGKFSTVGDFGDAENGSDLPEGAGYQKLQGAFRYDGGAGTNSVIADADADWRLTTTTLGSGPAGPLQLANVKNALLRGGASSNLLVVEGWAGKVKVEGGGESDQITVRMPKITDAEVDGGSGEGDELTVLGSAFGDRFSISALALRLERSMLAYAEVESIRVAGLEGDDTFLVEDVGVSVLRPDGGLGSDTYNIQAGASSRSVVLHDSGPSPSENGDVDTLVVPSGVSHAYDTPFQVGNLKTTYYRTIEVPFAAAVFAPTAVITNTSTSTWEGSKQTFDGSASTGMPGTTLTHLWQVFRGGQLLQEAFGIGFEFTPNDNGVYQVALTVTDSFGSNATATETVTIRNVAPIATIGSPRRVEYGQAVVIAFTELFDPSTDTAAGLRFAYGFDPDDVRIATYHGESSTETSRTYGRLSVGTHTIFAKIVDKDEDYSIYSVDVEVVPKALTASIAVADKVYDGTTSATISAITLSGVLPGQNVQLSGGKAAFLDPFAGVDKPVGISGLELVGPDASNNVLLPAMSTADIRRRSVKVVVLVDDKVYDGTDTAELGGAQVTGLIPGDVVEPFASSANFVDENVGIDKQVIVDGLELVGPAAANYSFETVAIATADITPRLLGVGIEIADKAYDGTTKATVAGTHFFELIPGDDVTLDLGGADFEDRFVGVDKRVDIVIRGIIGPDAGNYTVPARATSPADITARRILVRGVAADKVYDGTVLAELVELELIGRIDGDDIGLVGGVASFADKHVGVDKPVTLEGWLLLGEHAANYVVNGSSVTTADITPRFVGVRARALDREYDGTVGVVIGDIDLVDHVIGDDVSVQFGTARFDTRHAGFDKTVTLDGVVLLGSDAHNYVAESQQLTSATIHRKAIAPAIVAADKNYDGNTMAMITSRSLLGAIDGDDVQLVGGTAAFENERVGRDKLVTGDGFELTGADAGNYVVVGAASTTASIHSTLRVLGLKVNGGAVQRSNVETIAIEFSGRVEIAAAIADGSITRIIEIHRGQARVELSAARFRLESNGTTLTIDLTIDGFGGSRKTMLSDGRYEVRILAASVSALGHPGHTLRDDDGTLDGIHRLGFHRLEGDFDGNGIVEIADRTLLYARMNGKVGTPRYDFAFDLNGDGLISMEDYLLWTRMLNRRV